MRKLIAILLALGALIVSAPSWSAVAHVQSTQYGPTTATTHNFAAVNFTAGNTALVWVHVSSVAATVSTVADDVNVGNYTQVASRTTADNSNRIYLFQKTNVATASTTITVTLSVSNSVRAVIQEYSGVDTTTPINTFGTGTSTGTSSVTAGAITTTLANTIVVSGIGLTTPAQTIAPAGGETERQEVSQRLQVEEEAQASAGSYQAQWTLGGSTPTGYIQAALAPPSAAPAFDAAPAVASQTAAAYTVSYEADANATNIYCGAYIKDASAPTGAQLEAGTGAHGTATEATTGSADSIVITPTDSPAHPDYDLYCVLEGAGGYSSVASILDECLDAPSGKQIINCPTGLTSIGAGSPVEAFNAVVTPDAAIGDILVCDAATTPGAYALTVSVAGQFSYSGDASKQFANCLVYDTSVGAYHAEDIDWYANNQAPAASTGQPFRFYAPLNAPMTPVNLTALQLCIDPDDAPEDLTYEAVDPLPTGLAITFVTDHWELGGTATQAGAFLNQTWRCTDPAGEATDFQ